MKYWILFAGMLLLFFVLDCDKNEFLNSDPGKEIAKVYFLDAAYDMDLEEIRGARPSKLTCNRENALGPGIKVSVLDNDGNLLLLLIDNADQTNIYLASAEYTNRGENRVYKTSGAAMQNVSVFWRENLDICEFYFTGPSVILRTATNHPVQIDSLSIQVLRQDDF
jgi:hypothetical protein